MASLLTPPSPPGPLLRIADDADVGDWFDALAAGECTQDQFLDEMRQREESGQQLISSVLALLEQRHEQRRISHFLYVCIKARLRRPDPTEPTIEPARVAHTQPGPAIAPQPVPAPQALKIGTLLPGGYRVAAVLRQGVGGTLVEAIAERKAGLGGVRSRLSTLVMDGVSARDSALLQRIGRLQALSHPGILRVLDVEEADGSLLVFMESAEGTTLQELIEHNDGRRLATPAALTIIGSLASALQFAHAHGVSHGDLTPQNIVITHLGEVRLHGFLLRRGYDTDLAGDRMAFARMAYFLLSGTQPPVEEPVWGAVRLTEPPGVTRRQWRALRDALRLEHHGADVFAAFAGGERKTMPLAIPHAFAPAADLPRRGGPGDWAAAAVVALVLGGGGYLLFGAGEQDPGDAPTATSTAAVPAPHVPVRAAAAAVALPAAVAATAPASTTSPAPERSRPVIDLGRNGAWVDTSAPVARIWVRRRGSLEQQVSFQWWTENGSAQVGRDFRAILPSVAVIPSGARGVELLVPLIPDAFRREPRTFFVKIDRASRGASMGARTLLQVAIVPPGYPAARGALGATNAAVPGTVGAN